MENKIHKPKWLYKNPLLAEEIECVFILIVLFGTIAGKAEIFLLLGFTIVILVPSIYGIRLCVMLINIFLSKKSKDSKVRICVPRRYKLLKITEFIFSSSTQEEVFLPVMADWDREIFKAEQNKCNNKSMIHVRNLYAFLVTMERKSPIGEIIEFITKIAK